MREITKKPEVRTHTRYEMKQNIVKRYCKCQCGNPLILTNDGRSNQSWTECTCGLKFQTSSNSTSQPSGQGAKWPTDLKKWGKIRKPDSSSYGVSHIFMQSAFNIGRHTKKLFKEIEDLGGEVRLYYDMCADGRKRVSSFNIEFWSNCMDMNGGMYLSLYPENRNNKVINEHINYFLEDLRSLNAFKDKHGIERRNTWDKLMGKDENGKTVFWQPKQFRSSGEVCVESKMKYSY